MSNRAAVPLSPEDVERACAVLAGAFHAYALFTYALPDAEERARRFSEGTRIFSLAESLGGVESLVEIPAVMTHGSVANSPLEVSPALVRLSVGIEHPDDLVADVLRALDEA